LPAPRMPGNVALLWVLYAAYLAAPVYDIPFLGFSWSAILAIPLAIMALGVPVVPSQSEQVFRGFIAVLWAAIVLPAAFGLVDFVTLTMSVRFTYWLAMGVLAVRLLQYANSPRIIWHACFVGVSVLAAIAFFEKCYYGDYGAAFSRLTLMTQNSYGERFSIFAPFVVGGVAFWRGRWRLAAALSLALLLAAAFLLGSRGCWVGMSAGFVVFLGLALLGGSRASARMVVVTAGAAALVALVLSWAMAQTPYVEQRLRTFENLNRDKPTHTRIALTRKALALWTEQLWFGVGIGQFRLSHADILLPPTYHTDLEELNRRSSHNAWAQWLAETGLVGTVPLVLLWVWLFFRGCRAAVRLAHGGRYFGLVFMPAFVGMSVHLAALAGLNGTVPWFVLALVVSVIAEAEGRIGARVPAPAGTTESQGIG